MFIVCKFIIITNLVVNHNKRVPIFKVHKSMFGTCIGRKVVDLNSNIRHFAQNLEKSIN